MKDKDCDAVPNLGEATTKWGEEVVSVCWKIVGVENPVVRLILRRFLISPKLDADDLCF